MELKSYYDFAENDYLFFKAAVNNHLFANSMGAMAQNICERYIKHLINQYIKIDKTNLDEITDILSTHNLNRLIFFWNEKAAYPLSAEMVSKLQNINGYYFSTKYPGDDTTILTENDINECVEAIDACKKNVDDIIASIRNNA